MKSNKYIITKLPINVAALLTALIIVSGCDILQVDNPNSLIENDLNNPSAAPALANGAEATLAGSQGDLLAAYSTATDELEWIGTRDSWQELDQGKLNNPLNEFTDDAFSSVSEARWTADNAIRRLEEFYEEGTLQQTLPLVRSYLYGAVNYITIAASFDNFVIGNRQEAVPPVGESSMSSLYDTAIDYLTKGLALVQEGSEWEARLLAIRARAHFEQALWNKLNPSVATSDPLVASADGVDDANAALDIIGQQADWQYALEITSETPNNTMAFQVNERLELRIGDAFVKPTSNNKQVAEVTLQDPIDEIPAPRLENRIEAFVTANQYADITIVSVRELLLIVAEDALAQNNNQGFSNAINRLRALDNLSDYQGQVPAIDLLKHARQVNLFLQGRRLADLYRFEEDAPEWQTNQVTLGTFIPITITEIRSNPNISLGD